MRGLWFIGLLAVSGALCAQDNVLPGFKLTKQPTIDGTIDPAEWDGVPTGKGLLDDETGQAAADEFQFWLAYDDKYVYFAARAYDSQPSTIRATEYRTNVSLSGDDSVILLLDLGGSLADFNEFGMNAKGATQIELAGGRAAKREWSGEFVAKGRIVADGWEVEARIPWRIMRLPAAGARTVRFNVERSHKRTLRDYVWRFTDGGNQENHGKWTGVEIPVAPAERSIKLLPYGYVGFDKRESILDGGLDLKTQLAEQVMLVGSFNPDFRSIENAILSLDFSRFERLADETRPFFQEGNQYLDSALFASQRIPDFDAGLNVHGRLGDRMSFGVLDTVEFGGQNSFISNFSYDPTPNDSYRVTATNLSRDGLNNDAYLFRYSKQMGPYNAFIRTMGTSDSERGRGVFNSFYLNHFKKGLSLFAGWDAVSPDFLLRLGFVPETDYKGPMAAIEYSQPVNKGMLREVGVEAFWTDLQHYGGGHYRRSLDASGNLNLRNGVGIGMSASFEDFEGIKDHLYSAGVVMPTGNPYRYVSAEFATGRLDNADYKSVSLSMAYRPIERIQLTARYQHVTHEEKEDLGIFGFNYDLGHEVYISGRAVKRQADWGGYVSFRRSGNRGTEYYLIVGDPNARTFTSTVILKVVMPFEIR